MVRLIKEFVVSLGIAGIVAFLLYVFVVNKADMQVKGVVVEGDNYNEIDAASVRALTGDSSRIMSISLEEIGVKTGELLKARAVTLRRTPGMRLNMTVHAEHPAMWVKSDRLMAISSTGRILETSEVERGVDFPIFIGKSDMEFRAGEFCGEMDIVYALIFLKEVEIHNDEIASIISTVRVEADRGIIITIMPGEIPVVLGYSDYIKRTFKLLSVLDYLEGLEETPDLVDVRFEDLALIHFKKGEGKTG